MADGAIQMQHPRKINIKAVLSFTLKWSIYTLYQNIDIDALLICAGSVKSGEIKIKVIKKVSLKDKKHLSGRKA